MVRWLVMTFKRGWQRLIGYILFLHSTLLWPEPCGIYWKGWHLGHSLWLSQTRDLLSTPLHLSFVLISQYSHLLPSSSSLYLLLSTDQQISPLRLIDPALGTGRLLNVGGGMVREGERERQGARERGKEVGREWERKAERETEREGGKVANMLVLPYSSSNM